MGRRAHALLLAHMQRYSYSATGALRWKRDITEYADVLRTAHSPPIAALARAPLSFVQWQNGSSPPRSLAPRVPASGTRRPEVPGAARLCCTAAASRTAPRRRRWGVDPGGADRDPCLGAAAQMEELASYVTVLLVAPESLLGLVDASLRLPHAQALTFLRLREDFKSARVGGQTLAQVFARD